MVWDLSPNLKYGILVEVYEALDSASRMASFCGMVFLKFLSIFVGIKGDLFG